MADHLAWRKICVEYGAILVYNCHYSIVELLRLFSRSELSGLGCRHCLTIISNRPNRLIVVAKILLLPVNARCPCTVKQGTPKGRKLLPDLIRSGPESSMKRLYMPPHARVHLQSQAPNSRLLPGTIATIFHQSIVIHAVGLEIDVAVDLHKKLAQSVCIERPVKALAPFRHRHQSVEHPCWICAQISAKDVCLKNDVL